MLYTSTSLERVYHDFNQKPLIKTESENECEYKEFNTEHGHIRAKRTELGYQIDYIHSTNMEDYLNEDYAIGKIMRL